jgi:chromatin assembly factor 1 subunit A
MCDYDKAFPDFFVHAHTTIAPVNRFSFDEEGLRSSLAQILQNSRPAGGESDHPEHCSKKPSLRDILRIPPRRQRRKAVPSPSVKKLVSAIYGTASDPIDLTCGSVGQAGRAPTELLRTIPVKILKYAEDVRPPYVGTYTKLPLRHSASKLCRNPFSRALPATNYDYDSEAEWEEPEEGEDLESEGEEEIEEDEPDDMEGFLDDDDAEGPKRRHIMGDIEAAYTGIHWDDGAGTEASRIVAYGDSTIDLGCFAASSLLGMEPTHSHGGRS